MMDISLEGRRNPAVCRLGMGQPTNQKQIGKWVESTLSPIGEFVYNDWYRGDMKSLGQSYTAFPGRM